MFHERIGWPRADPNGITVYLIERLGNQLFAYSAALGIARRLGVPCYANLAFFRHKYPKRSYPKSFSLGGFTHDLIIPSDERYHRPILFSQPSQGYSQLWHRYVSPAIPSLGQGSLFVERPIKYDERVETVGPGTTLLGLFQSWRYFDHVKDEILERVGTLTRPSRWFTSFARNLRPGSGSIVLNVRRGDYMRSRQQSRQGLVGSGYYVQAARVMRRMGLDGQLYVASDSLDRALQELHRVENVVPIDPPPEVDPLEIMVLMSRADGLAIGNSTFSWWAAYLGDRPGQVVVAPRPWNLRTGRNPRYLLPPSWLTLDRDAKAADEL